MVYRVQSTPQGVQLRVYNLLEEYITTQPRVQSTPTKSYQLVYSKQTDTEQFAQGIATTQIPIPTPRRVELNR